MFAQGSFLKKKQNNLFYPLSQNKGRIAFPLNFLRAEIVSQGNPDLLNVLFFQNKMFRHLVIIIHQAGLNLTSPPVR